MTGPSAAGSHDTYSRGGIINESGGTAIRALVLGSVRDSREKVGGSQRYARQSLLGGRDEAAES